MSLFLCSNCQEEESSDKNQVTFYGSYLGMSKPGNSPVQFANAQKLFKLTKNKKYAV